MRVLKWKHHWDRDHAGFVRRGPNRIGKCPAGMSLSDAQALINDAVPYRSPRWRRSYPQRLYAISGGVVYRATPTNPGVSYHGFPEHPQIVPARRQCQEGSTATLGEGKTAGMREGGAGAVQSLCARYGVSSELLAWQVRNSGVTPSPSSWKYLASLVRNPSAFGLMNSGPSHVRHSCY